MIGQRICEKCGETVNILCSLIGGKERESSICKNCEENKLIGEAQKFHKDCQKRKVESIFERHSIVPEDLLSATFDSYIPDNPIKTDAKKKAVWYANNFKKILSKEISWMSMILKGECGLGKSHLSYSIARQLKEQGYSVVFIDVPSLLRMIQASYNKNADFTETDILEMCHKVDCLFLDDIGAEYINKKSDSEIWAVDKLFQIIQGRMGKPTVYTTNYEAEELQAKYGGGIGGSRIISRMFQGAKVIQFSGKDYRIRC